MKFIAIIPARYASTRFPAKPLAVLGGKPVIRRVYEQVAGVLDDAVVATDDERIYDAVADGERSFDQLASQTGLDASKLMASLTMLQILGAVKALPGKSYCRATE